MFNQNDLRKFADQLFYKTLSRELNDSSAILDLGCGANSPLSKIKLSENVYTVGVDVFGKSIKESKKKKIHSKYVRCNLLDIEKHLQSRKFDTVIAIDVIEHLSRKDGIKLISLMKRIASKKVIIFTPNGYYDQDSYGGNPYQVHKSGWHVQDFSTRGFNVFGLRGLKYLRGEYASIKYKPWVFWGFVSFISELFTYFLPRYAYHLFAVYKK